MQVDYLDKMGDDLMVVDAARVSFDKKSWWEYHDDKDGVAKAVLSQADTKLIKYLAKHKHWSPFSHPQIQIRVIAPIFVANQLKRSTVGLAINEVSRRYVDAEPTFYIPEKWRGRPPGSIKQGSSETEITSVSLDYDFPVDIKEAYAKIISTTSGLYKMMLEAGVAPEMARMVLPQSMNTSWIWTGSLLAFIRVYKQRIDSHSQLESQMFAKSLESIIKKYFPVSFEAWVEL